MEVIFPIFGVRESDRLLFQVYIIPGHTSDLSPPHCCFEGEKERKEERTIENVVQKEGEGGEIPGTGVNQTGRTEERIRPMEREREREYEPERGMGMY